MPESCLINLFIFVFFLDTTLLGGGKPPPKDPQLRIDSPPNMRKFFPHTPLQCAVMRFQMYPCYWKQHTRVVSYKSLYFCSFSRHDSFRRGQAPCLRIRSTLRTHSPPNMRKFFPHTPLQCAVLCFQMYPCYWKQHT